jgi:hypothetical protein
VSGAALDGGFLWSFLLSGVYAGSRGAAVDALKAADRIWAGTVEGGFILDSECISRIIKLESKQKTKAEDGDIRLPMQPSLFEKWQVHKIFFWPSPFNGGN